MELPASRRIETSEHIFSKWCNLWLYSNLGLRDASIILLIWVRLFWEKWTQLNKFLADLRPGGGLVSYSKAWVSLSFSSCWKTWNFFNFGSSGITTLISGLKSLQYVCGGCGMATASTKLPGKFILSSQLTRLSSLRDGYSAIIILFKVWNHSSSSVGVTNLRPLAPP